MLYRVAVGDVVGVVVRDAVLECLRRSGRGSGDVGDVGDVVTYPRTRKMYHLHPFSTPCAACNGTTTPPTSPSRGVSAGQVPVSGGGRGLPHRPPIWAGLERLKKGGV
jgi:hypothetical protein